MVSRSHAAEMRAKSGHASEGAGIPLLSTAVREDDSACAEAADCAGTALSALPVSRARPCAGQLVTCARYDRGLALVFWAGGPTGPGTCGRSGILDRTL